LQLIRRNDPHDQILENVQDNYWTIYLYSLRIATEQHTVKQMTKKRSMLLLNTYKMYSHHLLNKTHTAIQWTD